VLINVAIYLIFLLGVIKLFALLFFYRSEEVDLQRFASYFEQGDNFSLERLPSRRLISQRFLMVKKLQQQRAVIDQGALAAVVVANESTRVTLPKFVSNILILTGVFGTVVSLSIALVGASNLIDSMESMGNMGLIIHGMSTALSTTISAIICYLVYGYFFLKLTDVQTRVLSRVEEVTTLYLMPKYNYTRESVVAQMGGMIAELREAVATFNAAQQLNAESGRQLIRAAMVIGENVAPMRSDLDELKSLLREGFRLPEKREMVAAAPVAINSPAVAATNAASFKAER
ncbi:MAG: hypothetical protein HQL49_11510, partial [Gammaproteobacteria bacterium]|nr:hypothetical protein [Gammaproteobacteria bacterium]